MPIVHRFAQVFGAVYVLVGIVGFIPPLLIGDVPGVLGALRQASPRPVRSKLVP